MSTFAVADRQTWSLISQWVRVLLQICLIHAGPPRKTDLPIERGVGNGSKGGTGKRLISRREEKVLISIYALISNSWAVRVRDS